MNFTFSCPNLPPENPQPSLNSPYPLCVAKFYHHEYFSLSACRILPTTDENIKFSFCHLYPMYRSLLFYHNKRLSYDYFDFIIEGPFNHIFTKTFLPCHLNLSNSSDNLRGGTLIIFAPFLS